MDTSKILKEIQASISSETGHIEVHCPVLWSALELEGNIAGSDAPKLLGYPLAMGPRRKELFSIHPAEL